MRTLRSAALIMMLATVGVRAGELSPPASPAPTMRSIQDIYDQVAALRSKLTGDNTILFFPRVVETQGTSSNTPYSFDTLFAFVNTQNFVNQDLQNGTPYTSGVAVDIPVDLYLYDSTGQPAKSASNADVAFPATFTVGAITPKASTTLETLFQAAGGFPATTFTGYAIVRIGTGKASDVAVQAFTINAHANAFDLSLSTLNPVPIQAPATGGK